MFPLFPQREKELFSCFLLLPNAIFYLHSRMPDVRSGPAVKSSSASLKIEPVKLVKQLVLAACLCW